MIVPLGPPHGLPHPLAPFALIIVATAAIGPIAWPHAASAQAATTPVATRAKLQAPAGAQATAAAAAEAMPRAVIGTATQAAAAGAPLPRWDVTGVLGWRGVRFSAEDSPYNRWDHRAIYVAIAGYHWTSHLKTEVEIGGVAPSGFQTHRFVPRPDLPYPAYARTEHDTVGLPVSGRVLYQFGENAWFHPFAGAGVAFDWTRDRRHTLQQMQTVLRPDGRLDQVVIADESAETVTMTETRPVVITGFKAYATTRGFIRADLLWTIGDGSRRYVSWRVGVGRDF